MSRRSALVVVTAGTVLALLTGCTGVGPSPNGGLQPTASTPVATATPIPTEPAAVRYGKSHTWPDGLSVRVGAPAMFIPSTWVRTVNSFDRYLAVTVTLRNGSGKRVDLSAFAADGRASGKGADPTHDPGKLGADPPSKLGQGDKAVFRLGFGVPKRKGFSLVITAGPGYPPVRFTG